MDTLNYQYLNSPVGELKIGCYQDQLCLLDYRYRKQRDLIDQRLLKGLEPGRRIEQQERATPLHELTVQALERYFDRQIQRFDLPIKTVGSQFQHRVWTALMAIPYGATRSYAQIAEQMGQPSAVRAVANADGANALAILIPCHRVIGKNGALTGYAGGLTAKRKLLDLESAWI